jgi:Flp pilus assembly protein TadD
MGAIALAKEPPELGEAEKFLTVAVQLNPNDPSVRANLGEVFIHQKKFSEAAAELQKALELDPQKRDRGVNRARAILRAIQQMRQAHEVAKQLPTGTPN